MRIFRFIPALVLTTLCLTCGLSPALAQLATPATGLGDAVRATDSGGGGASVGVGTMAERNASGPAEGDLWLVTDAMVTGLCSVSGGTADSLCVYDGTAWVDAGASSRRQGDLEFTVGPHALTNEDFNGGFNVCIVATCQWDLPTIVSSSGLTECFFDQGGNGITIHPSAGNVIANGAAALAAGQHLTNVTATYGGSQAVGDYVCISAVTTNWQVLDSRGTWVAGAP